MKIHHHIEKSGYPAQGISCLNHVALINIYGPGMKDTTGIAARIFSAVCRKNISIILITQSSSEYSICFCVLDHESDRAKEALCEEFSLEIKKNL